MNIQSVLAAITSKNILLEYHRQSGGMPCPTGVIKNCRWLYNFHSNSLDFTNNKNFDRWANSRLIELHLELWEDEDGDIKAAIKNIINIFGEQC
jgi:hypothetical protein